MSSHPDLAYAVPAHPFHDFPSPPATGRERDTITLDEFNRRRAARARQINPDFAEEVLPELPVGWRNGVPRNRKNKSTRAMRVVDGVTLFRCCKCRVYLPASEFYKRSCDAFGIQPRCKVCANERGSE